MISWADSGTMGYGRTGLLTVKCWELKSKAAEAASGCAFRAGDRFGSHPIGKAALDVEGYLGDLVSLCWIVLRLRHAHLGDWLRRSNYAWSLARKLFPFSALT